MFADPRKPSIVVSKPGKNIPVSEKSPVVIDVGNIITVLPETTLKIRCPALGFPPPTVTWSKSGQQLKLGGKYSINEDGTLIIKGTTAEHAGKYTCKVENILGQENVTSTVLVNGE